MFRDFLVCVWTFQLSFGTQRTKKSSLVGSVKKLNCLDDLIYISSLITYRHCLTETSYIFCICLHVDVLFYLCLIYVIYCVIIIFITINHIILLIEINLFFGHVCPMFRFRVLLAFAQFLPISAWRCLQKCCLYKKRVTEKPLSKNHV